MDVKNDLIENMLKIHTREKNKNISDVLLMAIQEINDSEKEIEKKEGVKERKRERKKGTERQRHR